MKMSHAVFQHFPSHHMVMVFFAFLTTVAIVGIAVAGKVDSPFVSSEIHFADSSASGLSMVPASCPSDPHYSGQCSTVPDVEPAPSSPTLSVSRSCTATDGKQNNNLSWTAVRDAQHYHVQWCIGGGCTNWQSLTNTTNTSYTHANRNDNTVYRYRVRAHRHSDGQWSTWSNKNASKLNCSSPSTTPGTPSLSVSPMCSATSGKQNNQISWSSVNGASDYHLQWCAGAGCSNWQLLTTTAGTSYTHSNLDHDTVYRYRVRGHNHSAGQFGSYDYKNATKIDCSSGGSSVPTLSVAPTCSGTTGKQNNQLSWSTVSGSPHYHVHWCTGAACSNWQGITSTNGTSYTHTNLDHDTVYRYRVRAHWHSDNSLSDYSYKNASKIDCTSPPPPPPPPPPPEPPNSPTITATGACVTGEPYTIRMTATDPGGERIRYAIDWTNDGNINQFVPSSGYVNSGTTQEASRIFVLEGSKTIQVLVENELGLSSGWKSHTFSCSHPSSDLCPDGSQPVNGTCSSGGGCPVGHLLIGGECVQLCPNGSQPVNGECPGICPAGTVLLAGECVQCPEGYLLIGDQCFPPGECPAGYILVDGWCIRDPDDPTVIGYPDAEISIRVSPSVVRQSETTQIYWSAANVASCTVTGTDGSSYAGTFSSSGGQTSDPIVALTTYTLSCADLNGGTVEDTASVNILPVWIET